jgi:hypothetical protein
MVASALAECRIDGPARLAAAAASSARPMKTLSKTGPIGASELPVDRLGPPTCRAVVRGSAERRIVLLQSANSSCGLICRAIRIEVKKIGELGSAIAALTI